MFDVARALRGRGHDVFFFGTDDPANVEKEYRRYYPSYHDFAAPHVPPAAALAAIWSRRAARNLRTFLREVKPDVAHLHNISYHLTPSVIAALSRDGVPAVMTLHDYNILCPNHYFYSRGEPCFRCPENSYFACVTRRCIKGRLGPSLVGYAAHLIARRTGVYRRLARLIVPSVFLRERLLAAAFAADRVTLIPPAVDVEETTAAEKGDYFLYAGRLAPEKGVDMLISAAGLAGGDVHLKVAGAGPAAAALHKLARDAAVARVEFLGHVAPEELARTMAAARAVVVPSRWPENTPAVILEAFAAATAVVAARAGGVPEMVADGVEGLLFDPGDVRGLAAALSQLAADDGRARALGEAGRRRLRRDFSFAEHIGCLLSVYGEVAA